MFGNLSKNPVNLSNFIDIFGNSIFSSEATGSAIIPESPHVRVPQIRGNARQTLAFRIEKSPTRLLILPAIGSVHRHSGVGADQGGRVRRNDGFVVKRISRLRRDRPPCLSVALAPFLYRGECDRRAARGGPPCPPVSGMSIPVRNLGQARRPVPTENNLEGRIGVFQQTLKGGRGERRHPAVNASGDTLSTNQNDSNAGDLVHPPRSSSRAWAIL